MAAQKAPPAGGGPSLLDIGCGGSRDPRATAGLDFYAYPGVTLVHDVTTLPWPIADATFEGAVSHQLVEHLPQRLGADGRDLFFQFFDEVWRILKPGGLFSFDVPDYRWSGAYGDPTHRRYFHLQAFTHLWDPRRDALYPRRTWELVEARTEYWVGGRTGLTTWHLQRHLPRVNRGLQFLHVGTPRTIYVTIRKPR
jgi:SAM-dependent methyltransferase